MIRFVLISLTLIFTRCSSNDYTLEWRLVDNQIVYYKVNMESDISKGKLNFKINDKSIEDTEVGQFLKEFISGASEIEQFMILENSDDENIDFKMYTYKSGSKDKEEPGLGDIFAMMAQNVPFEGTINKSGRLIGKNMSTREKNLVSLFFYLPDKAVKVGDTWQLDIQLIENESAYYGDIDKTNRVKLSEIKKERGSLIAVLDYNVSSSVHYKSANFSGKEINSSISAAFKGKSEFDITRGKWRFFDGVMSTKQTGIIETESTQIIQLIRSSKMPAEVSKIINGTAEKEKLVQLQKMGENIKNMNDNKVPVIDKKQEILDENKKDVSTKSIIKNEATPCPVIYSVQIKASKEPIPLNDKIFKKIPGKVYETVKASEEYQYKYRTGKVCTMKEAEQIKSELQKLGFKGIFISKETKQP